MIRRKDQQMQSQKDDMILLNQTMMKALEVSYETPRLYLFAKLYGNVAQDENKKANLPTKG
jgi:hypothetical protein